MKNILVLGSSGMAGHVITLYLEQNPHLNVTNLARQKKINDSTVIIDVGNLDEFNRYLDKNQFDVIINCIGVLNRSADQHKSTAVLMNSYLPHFLENKYSDSDTRIIHLSTDCVFSGKSGGYTEDSFRDGNSFYDRSKALGELNNDKDLTFRMSIIGPDMDPEGIGLFNWFMQSTGEIYGYKNAIWNGITTIELAKAVEAAVFSELTGLYHLIPKEKISKFHLLNLCKKTFDRKDIKIIQYENPPIDKSLINTRTDFCFQVPSYEEMIQNMRVWVHGHKSLYSYYR
ncbi:MAG: sugar nucleotide-binding protein [Lacrimispora sp.]